jgi:tetratricopeptide (TPR) repeat protein
LAAALLIAVAGVADTAPAAPAAERWVEVTTPHFHFYSHEDPAAVMGVAADLERLRSVLAQIAPRARLDGAVPFRLYLFRDEAALTPFRPGGDYAAEPLGGPVAFLSPHEHGVFGGSLVADPSLRASRYVYKQYIHYVLAANLPELPLWFRQGLAELYSTFEVQDGSAHIGKPVEEHVLWLRARARGETLAAIKTADGRALELKPEEQAFFPISWAMTHYLVAGSDADRQRLPGYVARVVGGADPEVAFAEAFGRPRSALEAELTEYVGRQTFRYLRLPLSSLPEPQLELTEMTAAQVQYRLGDLLAHTVSERRDQAAAHFRAALALEPDHGLARAGLGWLAEQAGDPEGALAAYREAIERVPDDFLVQLLYGDRLLATLGRRRPIKEEELLTLRQAQAALRRATELAPRYPEAWARLGLALNLEPQGSGEAVAALERAAALLPARMDVALNLLLAHARAGDAGAAEALIASMAARGADAETLARAREIRLQLAFAEVNAHTHAGRLDAAADLLAWILAATRDPATAERAAAQLDVVVKAAQHNRFIELFRSLREQVAGGDPEAARITLAELRAIAKPGRQSEAVEELARTLAPPP